MLVLNRKMADNMYRLCDGSLVFTVAVLLEDENGIRLESVEASNVIYAYPAERFAGEETVRRMENDRAEYLGAYLAETKERRIEADVKQVAASRYTIGIPENFLDGLKDARLLIEYTGDIGNAFLNGRMINDNFANGAQWEIGLKDFAGELKKNRITLYIVPLKEGVNVKVDSAMATRREEAEVSAAQLWSVRVQPVYEINI